MSFFRVSPTTPGKSKVELNGHDISNVVRAIRYEHRAAEAPAVVLELTHLDVPEVTGVDPRMTVKLPQEQQDLLIRMGWSPPADDFG